MDLHILVLYIDCLLLTILSIYFLVDSIRVYRKEIEPSKVLMAKQITTAILFITSTILTISSRWFLIPTFIFLSAFSIYVFEFIKYIGKFERRQLRR